MPIIRTNAPLRDRDAYDFYPTDAQDVRAGLSVLPTDLAPEYILDPGAGTGVWGTEARQLWPDAWITGVDIRPLSRPPAYDFWFTGSYDYLDNREEGIFDLIIGNPPFGKRGSKKDRRAAEKFVARSLALLVPDGYLLFLLPLTFLAGQRRVRELYRRTPPKQVAVLGERPSFTPGGKTDNTEYSFILFQKGYCGPTVLDWVLSSTIHMPKQLAMEGF